MRSTFNRKALVLAATGSALALVLTACGGGEDSDGEALSGSIVIDGSSTVAPLSEAAAELFMAENNGVQVTVGTSGTGGGFEKFCNGETDLSDASRPIKDSEVAICEEAGLTYAELAVANDALTVLVNKDNPIDCLSVEQLAQVWGPDSTLANWNEIDGIDQDLPLSLYGPGIDSGTFDYFTEAINGEAQVQRSDYNNIGENDNTGITGVEGDAGGMFYVGYSYYEENQDRVKALEIDGGAGCTAPSMETVLDGSYAPLGRQLYIYPSDASLEKDEVLAFVHFYIDNAEAIAEAAGFIPLSEEQMAASRQAVGDLSA